MQLSASNQYVIAFDVIFPFTEEYFNFMKSSVSSPPILDTVIMYINRYPVKKIKLSYCYFLSIYFKFIFFGHFKYSVRYTQRIQIFTNKSKKQYQVSRKVQ